MLQAFAHLAGLFQGDLTWTQTSKHHHHHNHWYDKFIIHIILLHHPHSRYPDILVGAYSSGHAVYMKVSLDLTRFQQIVCGLGSLDDMLNISISCHILFHLYWFSFSIIFAGGASCSHGGQGQLWPTEQAGDHGDDVDDGSGQRDGGIDGESGGVVIVRDESNGVMSNIYWLPTQLFRLTWRTSSACWGIALECLAFRFYLFCQAQPLQPSQSLLTSCLIAGFCLPNVHGSRRPQ